MSTFATIQQPRPVGAGRDVTEQAVKDAIAAGGIVDSTGDLYINVILLAATIRQKLDPTGDPFQGVANDLLARSKMGEEKYGTILRTDNGRDSLVDAYQEASDLIKYLCQARMEGKL